MESLTVRMIQLAVACKLRTAFLFRPLLTFCQQFSSISVSAVCFGNKYAFQIPDRGADGAFHIITPKLTLRKRNRPAADVFEKADCIPVPDQFTKIIRQFIRVIVSP